MIAWGVDVSTKRIAIGGVDGDDRIFSTSLDVDPTLRGAQRLVAVRRAAQQAGWRLSQMMAGQPRAILVEDPTFGGRSNPPLIQAFGVTLEAMAFDYVCPVLEIPVGTWKKEVLGKGNAMKDAIWTHAVQAGGHPANQDEADAICVALAARGRL